MTLIQSGQNLETAYKFLEIANRQVEINPMLVEFISELKTMSGCAAIGIRLLDKDANIPYSACDGFTRFQQNATGACA